MNSPKTANIQAIQIAISSQADVIACRKTARETATAMGFGLADQTRLATAVSELARNALRHAGGGIFLVHAVQSDGRNGIQVLVEDKGPGILDIEQAMQDGYSTDRSLGLGLPAARRLVHNMQINSKPGKTTICIDIYLPQ
ncbi:MAG: anti-sigma regulatory factor [Mariprofundus sp.]|nr:anti-sigma regulatory factor [Mariprofundus sp.]